MAIGWVILVVVSIILIGIMVVGTIVTGSECSDCCHDSHSNLICESCENYPHSLRHDYVTYCETHNNFKKKGEKDAK